MSYDGILKFKTAIDGEGFDSGIQRITKAAKTALTSIAAAFSAKALIESVVRFGSEAESIMAKVSTLVEGTASECSAALEKISGSILETSSATGQAAASLAEAAYQALSASVPAEKTGQFVDTAAKLATGGFTSTASAVDLLTTAINAYGLDAADAQRISDSFIATQNKGKTTVNEIAASLGRVAPSAAAFSVSLYDTEAALAQMTKGGIATAESATYLKGMLNELGKDSSRVSKILAEQTGQSFTGLMASGRSLGEVLDILFESTNRDATAFANLWSSQEAGTGALSIVNQGTKDYAATLDAITGSAGATESAYGKMMDTFEAKKNVFVESAKNVSIAAYDLIEEPLKSAADKGIEVVQKLARYVQQNGDKILKTGKLLLTAVTSLTAAMLAFKASLAIAKTISAVTGTIKTATAVVGLYAAGAKAATVNQLSMSASSKALGTVMALASGKIKLATAAQALFNGTLLANPVVLVTAAVAALAAGLVILIKAQKDEISVAQRELEKFNERHEATTQLIEDQKELAAACDERAAADLVQLDNTERLAKELSYLVDENGNVAESDRIRAQFIMGELNEALGLEMRMTDGQIENYQELKDAVNDAIGAKRAEILLSAYEEEYKAAIQNRVDAQRQAASEQIALAQTESEIAKLREQHASELAALEWAWADQSEEAANYRNRVVQEAWFQEYDALCRSLEEKQAAYDESEALVGSYYETIANYEAAQIAMAEGDTAKVGELLARMGDAFITAKEVASKSAEEQKQILGQQYAECLVALDKYVQDYAAGVEGCSAAGLEEWQKYAEDARIEAEQAGVNIVDGQITGIDGKQIDLTNTLQSLCDTSVELCKSSKPEFQSAGADMGQGLVDGVILKSSALAEATRQAVRDAIRAARAEADSHSPSRKMIALGEDLGEGGEIGIRNKIPDMIAASKDYTESSIQTVAAGFRAAVFASQSGAAVSVAAASRTVPGGRDEPAAPATVDARQYITFEQPMQAPDEVSRAVRDANRFGLAGARH